MTALAVIPTITPVSPPRRAYSTSQLKTMATAIYNRLYVIYHELNPIVDAHNRAIDKRLRDISDDSTSKLVAYIGKHGKPVVSDDGRRYAYGLEIKGQSCSAAVMLCATGDKHVEYCTKIQKAASDEIERLKGMKIKYDCPMDCSVLAAVTDEAVFGTSDDPSAVVYNRFVAQANELRAQMKDRVIE